MKLTPIVGILTTKHENLQPKRHKKVSQLEPWFLTCMHAQMRHKCHSKNAPYKKAESKGEETSEEEEGRNEKGRRKKGREAKEKEAKICTRQTERKTGLVK